MAKKHVLVTGGFDPIHSGHIAYLNAAKELGDTLWVGINSDDWLTRKKGQFFMSFSERFVMLSSLAVVDHTFSFDDKDNSANDAINQVLKEIKGDEYLIFANGGDRTEGNTSETEKFSSHDKIQFKFGVGGEDKKNSSSWILENWRNQKTERKWGYYKVFDEQEGLKVKKLVISPNSALSGQRHSQRSEHWYILEGSCNVHLQQGDKKSEVAMGMHDSLIIEKGTWHKAVNKTDHNCCVLEVQYGEKCIEDDIERRS